MQHDAVSAYHWMSGAQQLLNAVALGQVTPGPVVLTTGAVGYAAAGLGGGLPAAAAAWLFLARRGVVSAPLLAAACGVVAVLAGAPV